MKSAGACALWTVSRQATTRLGVRKMPTIDKKARVIYRIVYRCSRQSLPQIDEFLQIYEGLGQILVGLELFVAGIRQQFFATL